MCVYGEGGRGRGGWFCGGVTLAEGVGCNWVIVRRWSAGVEENWKV